MGCGSSTATNGNASEDLKGKSVKTMAPELFEQGDVRDLYNFEKQVGAGNFGTVFLVIHKKSGDKRACKSISKRKMVSTEDVEDVRREIQIMKHLGGHPHVVHLYGAYEDKTHIHLVMEMCSGGELFDSIAKAGHFNEQRAAGMVKSIVSVVHHCHTMNVVHRDLKPENFLLTAAGELKATDFGLSRFWKLGEVLDEIVGSPFYVAPEVLKRQYGCEADNWSCGIILYILLCGWPPFNGNSTEQIFRTILTAPLDLRSEPWPQISQAAKDLVKRMLAKDPKKRLSAQQILDHPWLKDQGVAPTAPFVPEVLNRMRNFTNMNQLKRQALKVIARSLPAVELAGMSEMFKEMDADGSGTITVDELRSGLKKKGAKVALAEVERIMADIDLDGNQRIDYEEFLASTMHMHTIDKEDILVAAFKHFDTDNSGTITLEELRVALKDEASEEQISALLSSVDKNGDNNIDYQEFCTMMRQQEMETLKIATKVVKRKVVEMKHDLDMPQDVQED